VSATGDRTEELLARLQNPEAFLSRTDLRDLGFGRRAVDAIYRACGARDGVVSLPGYKRPLIRVRAYRDLISESSYAGDRVRPT